MNGCSGEGPSFPPAELSRRSGPPGETGRSPHPKVVRGSDATQRADLEFVGAGEVLDMKREEGGPARRWRDQAQLEPRSPADVETRRRIDCVESFAPEPENDEGETDISRELERAAYLPAHGGGHAERKSLLTDRHGAKGDNRRGEHTTG